VRPLLGTLVEIRVRGDSPSAAQAVERAFKVVERVHGLMSAHDPRSDVSRINRSEAGSAISVDPWTCEVLRRAKEVHKMTGGLFDCAVAPLLAESGYLPRSEYGNGKCGTLADLEVSSGCSVRMRRKVGFTLDGIAKGDAVDRAVEELLGSGVVAGVVNAGGDLRAFGEEFEPIHVRHPGSPGKLLAIGAVKNAAVASSAAYFSRTEFRGCAVSPIVDPRTMTLCNPDYGVTVLADDCMTADALTKPLLIDPARGPAIAAKLGAKAILIDACGTIQ
jgi:thiamine biosynthesis lipoprotein